MPQRFREKQFAEYADAFGIGYSIDMHKGSRNKDVLVDRQNQRIEIKANADLGEMHSLDFSSWLPFASREYKISSNIMDYILVPVITIPSDLPNRNGVAFPLKELTKFSIDQGRLAYKTFAGKPVHIEHANEDPTKAIGVIVDATLRKLDGFAGGKVWKLVELLAIDRSKDKLLASRIVSGDMNCYSMGAWVGGYQCSICNAEMGNCGHLHPREMRDFYEIDGKLCYRKVRDIVGFETSSVQTPAYVSAIQTRLFDHNGLEVRT
jgi:hypothetical protein